MSDCDSLKDILTVTGQPSLDFEEPPRWKPKPFTAKLGELFNFGKKEIVFDENC